MSYHIAINGVQSGPHPDEQVRQMIAEGRLKATDLCWREGWPNWRPVGEALGSVAPASAHASSEPTMSLGIPTAGGADDPAMAESIRREHLNHEASIQGIGSLFCLGGALLALIAAGIVAGGLAGGGSGSGGVEGGVAIGMGVLFAALAALQVWVGLGLRRLNPKSAMPATILAAIGLIGFPVGTLVNGYILYLIHNRKGKVVLGEGYREIVAATPHIRYRTPVWVIVVALALVGLLVAGIVAAAGAK